MLRTALPAFLLFTSAVFAQNAAPSVTITNVVVDEGASTVSVSYDLADAENDPSTVLFKASTDGASFTADVSAVSGDVGAGIAPGNGRTITWNYGALPDIYGARILVVADDGHAPSIQEMVEQVDLARMTQRLNNVAIPRHHSSHPEGIAAIRDSLLTAFGAAGLEVSTQTVNFLGTSVPNVIGRNAGLVNDHLTYIVDGHYDAVSNTAGADDNATGVAATLEIARILGQYRFRNSLRFIGFSYEEQGLVGSGFYVQNGIPAWEQVEGVMNMEMIGYYSEVPNSQSVPAGFNILFPDAIAALEADEYRGNFLTVVGNAASVPLSDAFLQACDTHVPQLKHLALNVPGNGQIAPDLRRSDHSRFWDAGMKALMLTDGSEFRNANYHTPNDVVATLDMEFFTNSTKAVLAAAAMLAEPINAGADTFNLASLVGVEEHLHRFPCRAEIFPNPTQDKLFVKLGDCVQQRIIAELFDLRGNKVSGRDLRITNGDATWELDVQGVAAGTYLLVLRAGESSTSLLVEIAR